ncbi:MAG: diaminopimelate epimerase [Candidatus Omnitrophica bacterium]|nr:diaminopimelate epimerase [Candidatus Omnitrophota bacterium]
MPKKITFYKMCGTGNDFVLIDNRKKIIKKRKEFAQKICHRHTGIGGDGLILIELGRKADLIARIFNADGSEAEMCGNGMRCAAWLAHYVLGFTKSPSFTTIAGIITTTVRKNTARVKLPDPTDFRDYAPLEVKDGIFYFYFINTGVPHCVIFEDNLDEFPVEKIGREIRHHPHFQPCGTNVNFVQIRNKKTIYVRTYERGVEAETLACGTGATASAIISALIQKGVPPITVITKSGESIIVSFKMHTFSVSNVFLEGPVKFICEGQLYQ